MPTNKNITTDDLWKIIRKEHGLKPTQLLDTNMGPLDILEVKDGIVYYGFVAHGGVIKDTVEDFLVKSRTKG